MNSHLLVSILSGTERQQWVHPALLESFLGMIQFAVARHKLIEFGPFLKSCSRCSRVLSRSVGINAAFIFSVYK